MARARVRPSDALLWAGVGAAGIALVYSVGVRGVPHALAPRLLYIVLPALSAVGLLMALRMSPARRANLSLALFSSALAIYAAEIIVGVTGMRTRIATARDHVDRRSKLAVLRAHRGEGTDAQPSLSARVVREGGDRDQGIALRLQLDGEPALPLAGVSSVLTVHCNESGRFSEYISDEHGFNNPRGLWADVPVEVVAIGDSFTHGACVDEPRNLVGGLRPRWPRTVNLGLSGSGPLMQLATLREYGPALSPRWVLWVYYEQNDLVDLDEESKVAVFSRYLDPKFSQGVIGRQREIDSQLRVFFSNLESAEVKRSRSLMRRALAVARLVNIRSLLAFPAATPPGSIQADTSRRETQRFADVMASAASLSKSWGGHLVFAYLPAYQRYAPNSPPIPAMLQRARVLEIVRSQEIPVIDLHDVLSAHPDPLELWVNSVSHFTENGYGVVSRAISASLDSIVSASPANARASQTTPGRRLHGR